MDRLDEIAREIKKATHLPTAGAFAALEPQWQATARETLRAEGFRSLLWDTGERRKLDTGRMAIVWGIAR
jgi:hypothetical protein